MNLLMVGCSYQTTPIATREKLAFDGPKLPAALREVWARFGSECVILSTCNRVELYTARPGVASAPGGELLAEFFAEFHREPFDRIRPHLYVHQDADVVKHLFRVASSLDSLVVGEGQIAGQVKRAYETALEHQTVGAVLNGLFQKAHGVAKRVRTETGITKGHISISSVAVDYVRQVFDQFDDKTILVIGAGKMGELTLKHLRELHPRRILVTNRSPEKAVAVALGCGGTAVPWDQLDDALAQSDIVLSTTGAPEPIMSRRRFEGILEKRSSGTMVILDIAVPRDFDPRIHDGDRACLFNIDDLQRIREQTLRERQKHLAPAEAIVEFEVKRFFKDWLRRKNGPIIEQLTQEFESRRKAILGELFAKLNGKLSSKDRDFIEGAFKLYQNQLLHVPITALADDTSSQGQHTLLEALRKLFRLEA
jgi:glutamyl-tRNA reductase